MAEPTPNCSILIHILDRYALDYSHALVAINAYQKVVWCWIMAERLPDRWAQYCERARGVWTKLQQHLNQGDPNDLSASFPDYWYVWMEIDAIYSSNQSMPDLLYRVEYRDTQVRKFETVAYDAVWASQHRRLLAILFDEQPKYISKPEDSIQQLWARRSRVNNPLRGLTIPLRLFRHDRHAVQYIIQVFTQFVVTTAGVIEHANFVYEEVPIEEASAKLENWFRFCVGHPLSELPLSIRSELVKVNVLGTFRVLLNDAFNILEDDVHPTHLGWRLHKHLLACATHEFVQPMGETFITDVICEDLGWSEFMDHSGNDQFLPIPNFIPEGYENPFYEASPEEHWQEFDPAELSDVGFKACGPRISPLCCSTLADQVKPDSLCAICYDGFETRVGDVGGLPMKLTCSFGHILHLRCLDDLINGILEFSNLCPECREEICEPRPRRPILQDDGDDCEVPHPVAALAAETAEKLDDAGMTDIDEEEL